MEGIAKNVGVLINKNIVALDNKQHLPMVKFAEFNGSRKKENLLAIHAIECEHDTGSLPAGEVDKLLTTADIQAIVYDSPSSTPDYPKWRIFLPLAKPLLVEGLGLGGVESKRSRILARANGVLHAELAPESDALVQCWFVGRLQGGRVPEIFVVEGSRCIDQANDLDAGAVLVKEAKGSGGGGTRQEDLTLEKEIVSVDGEVLPLRDWLDDLLEKEKIRISGKTCREESSGSDSAILGLTQEGYPCIHDTGTGITNFLTPEAKDEYDLLTGSDNNYLAQFNNYDEYGDLIVPKRLKMSLPQMVRYLVQITEGNMVAFRNFPRKCHPAVHMAAMLKGNKTQVGRDRVDSFMLWGSSLNAYQVAN